MTDPLLTVDDVAAELRVPVRTTYAYMRQMVRVVTGRHVRVTRRALDAWVESRTCEPIENPSSTNAEKSGGATGATSDGRRERRSNVRPPVSCGSTTIHVSYPRKRRG